MSDLFCTNYLERFRDFFFTVFSFRKNTEANDINTNVIPNTKKSFKSSDVNEDKIIKNSLNQERKSVKNSGNYIFFLL